MDLRRFNSAGVEQFQQYLAALRDDPFIPLPSGLLKGSRFTEVLSPVIEIDVLIFSSKFDAAKFFVNKLSSIPERQCRSDVGLWSWLAFLYFDQLCPSSRGHRTPKETVKYIARPGDHRYGLDKHLLFFPWKMLRRHGEIAEWILSDDLGKDTRVQREWTGYRHNLSTQLFLLGRELYWNEGGSVVKPGARTSRPGGVRRFVQLARQLEVTFDLGGMSTEQLAKLLPQHEFCRWLKSRRESIAG